MSVDKKELVQAQYHFRHLQLIKLAEEVGLNLDLDFKSFFESNQRSGKIFAALMMTPQVFIEALFKANTPKMQDDLWEEATKCLTIVAKSAYSQNIGRELIKASDPETQGGKFVELDSFRTEPPVSLTLAFATNSDALEIGHMRGKGEAIDYLLGKFSGETPLMRYRKDLLEKVVPLSVSQKNGISVGYLPTIVTGLNLRLLYTLETNMPTLSFYLKGFESES